MALFSSTSCLKTAQHSTHRWLANRPINLPQPRNPLLALGTRHGITTKLRTIFCGELHDLLTPEYTLFTCRSVVTTAKIGLDAVDFHFNITLLPLLICVYWCGHPYTTEYCRVGGFFSSVRHVNLTGISAGAQVSRHLAVGPSGASRMGRK